MKLTKETLKRIIKEELEAVMSEEMLEEGILDSIKSKFGFGDKEVDKKAERLKMLDIYVNNPMALFTTIGTMTRAEAAGEIFAHAKATAPEKAEEVKKAYSLLRARQSEKFKEGEDRYQQSFGENK
jgi:hypothetical protein